MSLVQIIYPKTFEETIPEKFHTAQWLFALNKVTVGKQQLYSNDCAKGSHYTIRRTIFHKETFV